MELTYNKDINGCPKSHLHDKLTLVALEHGSIKLHIVQNKISLCPNELAIINPYQIHSASNINRESNGLYALYLDKQWVAQFQCDLFQTKNYFSFQQNKTNNPILFNDFITLSKNFFNDTLCIEIKKEQLIQFFGDLLIDNTPYSIKYTKNSISCDIRQYIDQQITQNISLEKIANEFLITPYHLIRIFNTEIHMTPHQYIINQKVNLAKKLLSEGMSISEAALCAGFNDQSHLYKYFKLIFSISPKTYQKSLTQ